MERVVVLLLLLLAALAPAVVDAGSIIIVPIYVPVENTNSTPPRFSECGAHESEHLVVFGQGSDTFDFECDHKWLGVYAEWYTNASNLDVRLESLDPDKTETLKLKNGKDEPGCDHTYLRTPVRLSVRAQPHEAYEVGLSLKCKRLTPGQIWALILGILGALILLVLCVVIVFNC